MNLLLDTHILIWSLFESKKIGHKQRAALLDSDNEIFVSVVSLWEISLKYAVKKLQLKNITPDKLPSAIEKSGFNQLPLSAEEAASFYQLPKMGHKDPFDRLLIWQAIHNNMMFMSHDADIQTYQKIGLKIF